MKKKARIAIIGTGWWATETHIPALLRNPDAEIVALCDRDPDKLAKASAHFGIEPTFGDVEALLDGVELDGAIVVTNHAFHYPAARLCLERGLHLLVEKPLTLFAREARELVEAARRVDRELIVGYPYTYLPSNIGVRDRLLSGDLGEVRNVNGIFNSGILGLLQGVSHRPSQAPHGPGAAYADPNLSGGGHGHTQLTHLAGLLFFLTGLVPERVQGLMQHAGLAVEVAEIASVLFTNGAIGVLSGTADLGGTRISRQELVLCCAKGVAEVSLSDHRSIIHRPGREPEVLDEGMPERSETGARPSRNLVDVCLGRAGNGSPGTVGWRAVELLDAAYRSARQGGTPIRIEELYDEDC